MNNIVAEEYKIGNCVKAQFSCGVIANIIITGIAVDKLGGACLEYKAMERRLLQSDQSLEVLPEEPTTADHDGVANQPTAGATTATGKRGQRSAVLKHKHNFSNLSI